MDRRTLFRGVSAAAAADAQIGLFLVAPEAGDLQ